MLTSDNKGVFGWGIDFGRDIPCTVQGITIAWNKTFLAFGWMAFGWMDKCREYGHLIHIELHDSLDVITKTKVASHCFEWLERE